MTVPELIANVLDNLRRHFYADRTREFKRDERQLIKAIATYGHECNQRGWPFQAEFIHEQILKLLLQIRTSGVEIEYLPIYLAGAVRRHIGLRAEELNAKAKAMDNRVDSVLAKIPAATGSRPAGPSDVEVFSSVFNGISRIQRSRKAKPARAKQEALL